LLVNISPIDSSLLVEDTPQTVSSLDIETKSHLPDDSRLALQLRYQALSSQNNQLSLPPLLSSRIIEALPMTAELFSSPFNRHSSLPFCSLFPDLEREWGSLGSFFDYEPGPGVYFANPPFDAYFMEMMARRMITHLSQIEDLTYVVTLPLWDHELRSAVEATGDVSGGDIVTGGRGGEGGGESTIAKRESAEASSPVLGAKPQLGELRGSVVSAYRPRRLSDERPRPEANYAFTAYDLLRDSGYVKLNRVVRQGDFFFVDHETQKCISPCGTHFVLLSNSIRSSQYARSLSDVLQEWVSSL
jgi:hypothetical protein